MARKSLVVIVAAALSGALSACASTPHQPPIEVSRYHLDNPVVVHGSVRVETPGAGLDVGPYAAAVSDQLTRLGLQPITSGEPDYVATVTAEHKPINNYRSAPPVTIGIGGGTFSGGRRGGVGLGGEAGIPIGHGKLHTVYGTELSVLIRRRSDATLVWEGHAQGVTGEMQAGDSAAIAGRFATALFGGFPGESGIPITVK